MRERLKIFISFVGGNKNGIVGWFIFDLICWKYCDVVVNEFFEICKFFVEFIRIDSFVVIVIFCKWVIGNCMS